MPFLACSLLLALATLEPVTETRATHRPDVTPWASLDDLSRIADSRQFAYRFRRARLTDGHTAELFDGVLKVFYTPTFILTEALGSISYGQNSDAPIHISRVRNYSLVTGELTTFESRPGNADIVYIEYWKELPDIAYYSIGRFGIDPASQGLERLVDSSTPETSIHYRHPRELGSVDIGFGRGEDTYWLTYKRSTFGTRQRVVSFVDSEHDTTLGAYRPTVLLDATYREDALQTAFFAAQLSGDWSVSPIRQLVRSGTPVFDYRVPGMEVKAVSTDRDMLVDEIPMWLSIPAALCYSNGEDSTPPTGAAHDPQSVPVAAVVLFALAIAASIALRRGKSQPLL